MATFEIPGSYFTHLNFQKRSNIRVKTKGEWYYFQFLILIIFVSALAFFFFKSKKLLNGDNIQFCRGKRKK
ncbi:hypothetical protein EGI11_04675 [Chryseobacterium sp. H3056]|uniref:Uncharacterized protein n=1 Tax=Kaistella daneshvariae TaxID=2487074 RepID=A0A3N0WY49_9FLAO|nr:hypothetical protein EGI11_04675 [Kaistella daneshvariae]